MCLTSAGSCLRVIFLTSGSFLVAEIPFRKILGLNQQSYQRLKLCLSLNLRRQIFIAVCDDLPMRDRLAAQLQAELERCTPDGETGVAGPSRLISLNLSMEDPNPIVQIGQWLAASPESFQSSPPGIWQQTMPAFQLLGIEKLTRQPAALQRTFFTHLQSIEHNLPLLESSLILWLTQPWFRSLPHSAPEFWRCRTGVVEFIGDPTPIVMTFPERIGVPQPQQALPQSVEESGALAFPIVAQNPWDLLVEDLDFGHLFEGSEAETQADSEIDQELPAHHPLYPLIQESTDLAILEPATSDLAVLEPAELAILEPAELAILEPAELATLDSDQSRSPAVAATLEKPEAALALTTAAALSALPAEFQSAELRQLPLVQQLEQMYRQQAPAASIATVYCTLGNLFRDQVEQGNGSVQQMAIAIQAYEHALHHLPEASPLWVDILNDLGNLYWMLSRTMPSTQEGLPYLQRGLQAYQLALTKISPSSQSHTYPMVQNNLGAAYADLARYQDPADSLRMSVEAYLQALHHRSPQTEPLRYASTQNNLGTTYWNLAQHQQPQANLKQAIAAYSEALRFYDPAQEPLNYAMIQNNLGTAYWNLAQYDRPRDWLALSLASYRMALKYRTLEVAPVAYAATQNNIGTAYWHMANHAEDGAMRADYLKQAIAAYDATLEAADHLRLQLKIPAEQPLPALNFDIIATQNNLGLAHYQLATDQQAKLTPDQQKEHLSAALTHHLLALQAWAPSPELRQTALTRVIETLRAFYNQLGMAGQNQAMSMVPGQLLPEILPRL
jgi:tetratricopeptide (TPR) repeat protein